MSPEQKAALSLLVITIFDCIKEAGKQGIPSGHLYAMLCGKISLNVYQTVIDALHTTGKIESVGFLLRVK